ncbi:BppU family phage baseplate upper protein [Bacillus cereus]|uniref:BppU family phage baseplate upper protein n=1 Tax=Bacillus cereus TaxID=1396 RepID=UPI0024BCFBA1|nr:BppU family phage baseplate upper protein [Bacillus cereus]WLG16077.1 BppU family phage baseplate upper protein [Bacillus cereus]
MAIKETVLTLDLTREGRHPVVKFRLNDNKVQKITFRLTNNGREVDLEREMGDQFKPVFECIFRDKTFKRDEDQSNWEIKRDTTGKYPLYTFTYYLTDEVINKSGIACYYFALETPEGLRVSTPTLKMVIDCDFKEDGKPSENYVSEFEKLLKEAGRVKQTIEDLDETLKEVLAGGASITEVIRARKDATGVIFKDLKERLDTKERKYDDITSKNSGSIEEIIKASKRKTKNILFLSDFEDYVIMSSGKKDWTKAVQTAINQCPEGGLLILNVLDIPCYGNLIVYKRMTLQGLGRDLTTFHVYSDQGEGFIHYDVAKTCTKDLGFHYPEQVVTNDDLASNNGNPKVYPPTLHGNSYYSTFSNINFGNTYYAMRFGIEKNGVIEHSSSAVTINNIVGTPLYRGLVLDACRDIPKICDIHWNRNIYAGSDRELGTNIHSWIKEHAYGFQFAKVDWGTISKLFAYGYNRGLVLEGVDKVVYPDKLTFDSCSFDQCKYPLWAQTFQNALRFRNCNFISLSNGFINIAPQKDSPLSLVLFDGCSFFDFNERMIQSSVDTIIENCEFRRWGKDKDLTAAVYFEESNKTLIINNCILDAEERNVRGLFNSEANNKLIIRGTKFKRFKTEPYRWKGGVVLDEFNDYGGFQVRNGISFASETRRFKAETIPSEGVFKQGDYVELTNPKIIQGASGKFVIAGWLRLTDGSNHQLGVDWVEHKLMGV